jgi:hypothetical protein
MNVKKPPRTPRARRPAVPTPEEYSAFVGQIDLLDVWLIESRVENRHGPHAPRQADIAISSPDPTWEKAADGFTVAFSYEVSFTEEDTVHATLEATFGLHFSSETPLTKNIFAIFKDVNLPVNTWPFLREFISHSMGRMGWQPFTIPAYKVGVPNDEGISESQKVEAPSARTRAKL